MADIPNTTPRRDPVVALFLPRSEGGHPRYGLEVADAIAAQSSAKVYYLCGEDLNSLGPRDHLTLTPIFPRLKLRSEFRNALHWKASRILHYTRRELLLIRWLRSHPEVDVLYLQEPITPWMMPLIARIARRENVSLAMTVHNLRPHNAGSRIGLREWAYQRRFRHLDRVFFHRGLSIAAVQEGTGLPLDALVEIEHGLFIEDVDPPSLSDNPRLVLIGTLSPYKGVTEAVEAMKLLPHLQLDIYGRVDDQEYIDACREGSPANVGWHLGFVDDAEIAEVFKGSVAALLPYRELAAQSGVLHLALGCGRPVVVTPAGAMPSVVERFECGVVASEATPAAITRAISELLEPDRYIDALAGVAKAKSELSWSNAARATLEGLRSL